MARSNLRDHLTTAESGRGESRFGKWIRRVAHRFGGQNALLFGCGIELEASRALRSLKSTPEIVKFVQSFCDRTCDFSRSSLNLTRIIFTNGQY